MSKQFDLSTLNLSAGTHRVTVKARASGCVDSAESNAVSYTVAGEGTAEGYKFTLLSSIPQEPETIKITIEDTFTTEVDDTAYNTIWKDEHWNGLSYHREIDYYYYIDDFHSSHHANAYYDSWENDGYRTITIKSFNQTSNTNKQKLFSITDGIYGCIRFTFSGGHIIYPKRFAPSGMTWREYVKTPLNCDYLDIYDEVVRSSTFIVDNVRPDDVITNKNYTTSGYIGEGGGSN